MNIPHSLLRLATRLLPTKTKLIVTGRQNLPSIAPILDVNELQCILREAEMGYCDRLFALYRDILASHAHTQGEFAKRKLAVLGDTFTLTSKNPKNAAEEALNKDVQEHLTDRPGWLRAMSHMLDSTLYPVSLMERWYAISAKPGWRWEIGGLRPVPHLHLAWPYGEFSLRDTDPSGYFTGTYTPPDPSLHIIHQGNLLTSVPDWWGGPMRALLFWWLFSVMDRDWWVRFLDRFGGPFLVGKHDASDEGARIQLEQAFSLATKIFGLAVTKDVDIQMMQANTNQGGDAFELFHSTANREISKLIVGQTLSAEGVNLGLGGGQAHRQQRGIVVAIHPGQPVDRIGRGRQAR